jgi:hypothetical protein
MFVIGSVILLDFASFANHDIVSDDSRIPISAGLGVAVE